MTKPAIIKNVLVLALWTVVEKIVIVTYNSIELFAFVKKVTLATLNNIAENVSF